MECPIKERFQHAYQYLKRKKVMSPKTIESFLRNLYLVFSGIRHAYMFENFSCSEEIAIELITNIKQIFSIDKVVIIIVLDTLDILIILRERLLQRTENFSNVTEENSVIINVSGIKEPELCPQI